MVIIQDFLRYMVAMAADFERRLSDRFMRYASLFRNIKKIYLAKMLDSSMD